ncbi:MAG: PaaI family thioesterase [Halorhodospira halophila]|uniref:PaaI family thioesterase n=1 Tax=Halorhodospira TaxID=85108 RepID=UPI001912C352|nr:MULTISPECIES: PaaI family thioesterase [Halorhodospira]MBK5936038.1 thioesterase [Halorhodospira halophila]MCC3749978.1 PaaI family thioesterase [Halorhodospira halophila]MCG5528328.1 PaaI family thioesterase [Halorhodospira halophila]MCG5532122.1 PaaI family thioesterase [Halorhodospira sp. 9621]MCG5538794.1 PaaI family thioesterase [Halorhodospira sp. 9622]
MTAETDNGAGIGLEHARRLFRGSPHGALIGLELVELGDDHLIARVPYRPELVGNPETGHIHGGVITTLIDQSCGAAVLMATGPAERIVTLDLRVDHLRPAAAGRDVYARCECYRLAGEVAFARAVAYEDDPAEPFATSMSAFMRLREGVGRG